MKYVVRDREAGNIIEYFTTMEEAEKTLQKYEESDKEQGIYEENFYEVAELPEIIKATEYGKELAGFVSTEELLSWLKNDYREQWWINGYKTFIKEVNKNIEKQKIFEYGDFRIERR